VKVLSLFSGVGGFDLGLENAGMETVFQCEWDKHATKILERHWPHVPRWTDVSTLTGEYILRHAPVIDVVAWGSPCQDLSVAGKRAGLQGARSGLFHEGVRIIKELRSLTNGKYPRISIWENVAGALSSGAGADFGQVLTEMDEAGACFSEWRILDAQYFGVPQRRRRVFLISVFDTATAARCPDPLLPVSEGVQWHPQTSNTARQTVAGEVAGCLRSGGAGGVPSSRGEHLVVEPASVESDGFRMRGFGDYESDDTASAIKARDHKDATDLVVEPPILIDRAAFNQGVNAKYDTHISDDPVVPSLVARGPHAVATEPVLLTMREGKPGGGKGPLLSTDKSLSPRTGNEQTLFAPVAFDGYNQTISDVSQTIRADKSDGDHVGMVLQAVAYDEYNDSLGGQVHHALRAGTKQSTGVMVEAAGFKPGASADARTIGYEEGVSPSLEAGGGGNNKPAVMTPTMAVRRLTPLECERLMGWPDDWTAGQPDSHRYKQCGNGVASPVAQWIGEILIATDSATATDA
jgi:DNA (cytosine-5)-methyltransferase 1